AGPRPAAGRGGCTGRLTEVRQTSDLRHPYPDRLRVPRQALGLRQRDDVRRVLFELPSRVRDHADALHEIVHSQRRNISGSRPGGQHVGRPGEVVAYGLGARGADIDRPGVSDAARHRPGITRQDLDVLGGPSVGDVDGGVQIRNDDDDPVVGERPLDDRFARRAGDLPCELGLQGIGERRAGGDTPGAGVLIVLGLGDQVRRDEPHLGGLIGDDQHLCRTRQHVDSDVPRDLPLRFGDEPIARTHDLVDARNRGRPVSERGDRLRAPDPEHPIHAGESRRGQYDIARCIPARGRRDHHDLRHTCDDRGNGVHDDGRGIGGLAAGDVQPDAFERHDPHPDLGAVRVPLEKTLIVLVGVIVPPSMPGLMSQSIGVRLIALVVLVLANAFFVAAEFALVAARRTRIDALVRRGDRKAKTVQTALQDLYRQLSAAQLGITVASILLGYVAEDTVAHLFRDWFAALPPVLNFLTRGGVASVAAVTLISFLHVVFGEQAPKAWAITYPEATSRWIAAPLILFSWITRPFTDLLNWSAGRIVRLLGIRSTTAELERIHSPEE